MWQTKYALAEPKNLGLGLNFRRAVKEISSLGVRSPCVKPTQQNLKVRNQGGLLLFSKNNKMLNVNLKLFNSFYPLYPQYVKEQF